MTAQDSPPTLLRFGSFELDLSSGELRRSGKLLDLPPQPFEVLALLASEAGRSVRREEIRRRLWAGETHVDFDQGINTAIRQIRAVLGDRAESPRFIQTLPRRGYRFLAPVERVAAPAVPSRAPGRRRLLWGLAGAAALVLALAAAVGFGLWRGESEPWRGGADRRLLAVLPFESLTSEPGDADFSAGLTEELISQLGRLAPRELGVIARTSVVRYQQTSLSAAEIASELGVGYLLEGTVWRDGERLRITAQLIQAGDQTHLWAATYERRPEDVFSIQADVASRVTGALSLELLPGAGLGAPTANGEAYEAYLRARSRVATYRRDGYEQGIALYERAIVLDPGFALAWAGLAEAYDLLSWAAAPAHAAAFTKAKSAARKALDLDPSLAEAHLALAIARFYFDWDWAGAEESFRRAVELDPGNAEIRHWLAGYLSAMERHDEAITEDRIAGRLDPLSQTVRSDLGWYLYFAGRHREAAAQLRRSLELDPHHRWSLLGLLETLVSQGDLEAAREPVENLMRLGGAPEEDISNVLEPDSRAMLLRFRSWQREDLEAQEREDPVALALVLATAGRSSKALDALEEALEVRAGWLVFSNADPRFDPLRGERRFAEITRSVGLPPRHPTG